MAQRPFLSVLGGARWVCNRCTNARSAQTVRRRGRDRSRRCQYSTSAAKGAEVEPIAAREIDFGSFKPSTPARVIPASASYFTGFPLFNDDYLLLQNLVDRHERLPQIPADKAPRMAWLKLTQYRSASGEQVGSGRYALLLRLLTRLNRIHPQIRPDTVNEALSKFQRPDSTVMRLAKPGKIDEHGRATAVGRRKTASAKVYLVEGTGEILVNSKNLVDKFPRAHDRESAMWPLKVTERLDKYNVFAMASGGGVTGQAEAITLALAKALLVHEPALKPLLRRAGCITRDTRRVERKKPGRLKARKRPAWVKR